MIVRSVSVFWRNIPLLSVAQALMMSAMSLVVSTTALVGSSLAGNKSYATIPYAALFIASVITSIPAAWLMSRIGRKRGFMWSTVFGLAAGIICTMAIIQRDMGLFVVGSVLIGVFNGFGNYFRFAAADAVPEEAKSRAVAYVLIGGVVAAVVGPNLAYVTQYSLAGSAFAGSYAVLVVLYLAVWVVLSFLKLPDGPHADGGDTGHGRPLSVIVLQPKFIVAVLCAMLSYAVMSFLMTATPLAMQHHHHDFAGTSFVIQWHVLGMTAPSFITGHLIRRFGVLLIMLTGALLGLLGIVVNLTGVSVVHFWLALLALGVSWNFLFIGATTLLTETYLPQERFKTQAINDLLVFSAVAVAVLSSGTVHHYFGWRMVNYCSLPAIVIILLSLAWLRMLLGKQSEGQQAPVSIRVAP